MSKKFLYRASPSFSLLISQEVQNTLILMKLNTRAVNTRHIQNITELLQLYCPTVLRTRCFNERNIPFRLEVKATEIGHLFEHILLEELCVNKLACGVRSAVFNGRTNWNWIKEPRGLFHITIDAGFSDQLLFPTALSRAMDVTESILTHLPDSQKLHNNNSSSPYEMESYLSV